MKNFLIILAFFPLSLFAQQSVLSSFNGYGDIVNVIDVDPTDSLFTIEINNFYGSPRFQPFGPWIAQDVQVGMVMWVDCARFVITNVNSASFSTMNIDVKVPSVDWNLGVATPLPNSRCAVVFEDQYLLTALPAPADGNSGALSGINNTLFACMLNHYSQALLVTKNSVNEITDYVAGLDTIPSEAPGPNIGETWRNSVGQLFYSNGTQWLTDKEVKFSNASLEGLPSYLYKLGIDTLGQDTLYISNNGIFKRFQSGLVYKEGYGINIFATDSIEVDTNQIATQNDLTPFISGTGANGQVSFWTGLKTQSGSNNLFWDNSLSRLLITGLGTQSSTNTVSSFIVNNSTEQVFKIRDNFGFDAGRGLSYVETGNSSTQGNSTLSSTKQLFTFGSGNTNFSMQTGSLATITTNGNVRFKVMANASNVVTIGNNDNPLYTLDITGTSGSLGVRGNSVLGAQGDAAKARLQVIGSGSTSSTFGLIVTNSDTTTSTASLVVRNDKRVGILTNNPAQTLHVAGTMRLTGNAGTATEALGRDASGDISGVPFSTIVTSGGGLTGNGVVNYLSQYNSTSTLDTTGIIWVGGRMGIGATAPAGRLHVVGQGGSTNIATFVSSAGNTIFQVRDDNYVGYRNLNSSFPTWFTSLTSPRVGLQIDQTLNTYSANVTGVNFYTAMSNTAGISRFYELGGLFNPTSGTATYKGFEITTTINQTGGANGDIIGFDYNPSFTNRNGRNFAALFRSGNVGIGTATPNANLRIQGYAATASTFGLIVTNSDTTTANATLVVRDDKRVGIGTNAPTDQLHTTGSVRLQNYPNTLNSTGNPVNVLSTSSTGVVESHPISEVISSAGGVTGSGAAGQVTFWNGTSTQSGDNGLFWDNTNKRLGVGITTPQSNIHVASTGAGGIFQRSSNDISSPVIFFRKTRGTIASPLAVQSGDLLGTFGFEGLLSNNTTFSTDFSFFGGQAAAAPTATTLPINIFFKVGSTASPYNASFYIHHSGRSRFGTNNMLSVLPQPNAKLEVVGEGETSGTTAFLVRNGAATPANLLSVLDNGDVGIGNAAPLADLHVSTGQGGSLFIGGGNGGHEFKINSFSFTNDVVGTAGRLHLNNGNIGVISFPTGANSGIIINPTSTTQTTASAVLISTGRAITNGNIFSVETNRNITGAAVTSSAFNFTGARNLDPTNNIIGSIYTDLYFGGTFSPSAATNNISYNGVQFEPTINQRNGTNAPVRGVLINPTLTSAPDFRGIEWTNSSGYGLYGSGTANNYLGGSLSIGTVTPTRTLDINGETRIRDLTTTTATGLVGADADGVLSNVTFASAVSQGGGLTGNGVTNYLAQYNSSNTLDTTGIIWTGGRMGIGTATPSSTFDVVGTVDFQNPTTAFDSGVLGAELLTTGTGTNWTGTGFSTGYTHTVGSTAALVAATSPANATYYQIVITTTGRTAGSFTFSFGGYTSATISADGTTTIGPLTTSTSPLTITPTTDFNGTVSATIKSIGNSSAVFKLVNSGGTTVFEQRASNSDNNMFLGRLAGLRNTTGVANTFIGSQAGQNNTTASFNTFIGNGAGSANVIGESNLFIGAGAGGSNRSGSNNFFMGRSAGINNTVGSSNLAIGTSSGVSLVRGNSNVYLGGNTGQNNVSGSNNVLIGVLAGRFYSESSLADTSINNSIFIGTDTRSNLLGQTNQIIIANSGRGLGSNTTRIGNSNTIQTHLDGRLTIGNTFYDSRVAARIVGADASTSNYSLVVTDSDGATSTTVDPNFVVRNDGNVGIGTYSPGAKLQINGSGNTNTTTSLNIQNSDGTSLLRVRDDLYTSINYLRVGNSFTTSTLVFPFVTNSGVPDAAGTNLSFYNYTGSNSAVGGAFAFAGNNFIQTSGNHVFFRFSHNFFPTSGNATYSAFTVRPSINQTGGANGITRGFHIDPSILSAADWRSIEWSNSTGYGLYGAGTANNYLAGSLGIGSTTPARLLHVQGEARISDLTTDTPTRIVGADADGDLGEITLGSGLSITSGVLNTSSTLNTGSGTAGQVTFWNGTNSITGDNNLFWDNANGRLGVGTNTPAARYHQSQTQGVFGRYDITNANANQNRGVWEFYTNTAATPDFFGRFGFKFEGGVSNASKQYQVHVSDATNPRLVVNGVGDVGIGIIAPTARLHVQSSNNISTTTAINVQNSDGNALFRVFDNGVVNFGTQLNRGFWVNNDGSNTPVLDGTSLRFSHSVSSQNQSGFYFRGANTLTATSGAQFNATFDQGFAPTSGTATFNQIVINNTINQTGGANGITRGLLLSPTLTSAFDWRSIQWNNNTGFGLYGEGTAPNRLNGILSLPLGNYNSAALQINSDAGTGLYSAGAANVNLKTSGGSRISLENASANYLRYSEDFPNAIWTKTRSNITSNAIMAPDSTLTADFVFNNGTAGLTRIAQNPTVPSGTDFTFSIFIKQNNNSSNISIGLNNTGQTVGGQIYINPSNFTIFASSFIGGSAAINPTLIENHGNGWYRVILSVRFPSAITGLSCFIDVSQVSGEGVYVWGAQAEAGGVGSSYIETVASAVGRPQAVSVLGSNVYGTLLTRTLGAPSFQDLSFTTQNATRMTITNGGSVGIGTTLPNSRLDVQGTTAAHGVSTNIGYNVTTVTAPVLNQASVVVSAGGNMTPGTHHFKVTYYNAFGGTEGSNTITAVTDTINKTVTFDLPVSTNPTVIGRRIYKSIVPQNASYGTLIATVANNTATSFTYSSIDPIPNPVNTNPVAAIPNLTSNYFTKDGTRSFVISNSLVSVGPFINSNLVAGPNVALTTGNAFNSGISIANNVTIGSASPNLTTGAGNVVIGYDAFALGTTASYNIAIGQFALNKTLSSERHVAVGYSALNNVTSGQYNVGIGMLSGNHITTGSNNTFLGSIAGSTFTGGSALTNANNSIFVGYSSAAFANSSFYETVIGVGIAGLGNNTTRIGSGSNTNQTHLDGRLTVGNTLYDANTTARIVGLNNTGSTYALVVTNSTAGTNTTSTPALVVTNEQRVGIGTYSPTDLLHVRGTGASTSGRTWIKVENTQTNSATGAKFTNGNGRSATFQYSGSDYPIGESFNVSTSSDYPVIFMTNGDIPTGGASYIAFQPGGYLQNQIFRAYKEGVSISNTGAVAPAKTLHVTGEVRISDLDNGTATRIVGATADGDLDELTLGSGLSITSGTISVTNPISASEVFIESSTATTIDLDANTGVVKDVNGTNASFTLPTDLSRLNVYKNGIRLARTGTATTRDFSVNTGTNEITFTTALLSTDRIVIVKI